MGFTLNGVEFTLVTDIPFAPIVDLVAAAGGGDGMAALPAVPKILTMSVIPEQRDQMAEAIGQTGVEQLGDIARWIVEMATNRPTRPSSASSDGRPEDGEASTSQPEVQGSAA